MLAIHVADQFKVPAEGATFLKEMKSRVVTQESALILVDLKIAELELHSSTDEFGCVDVLTRCESKCNGIKDLDSVVFSHLYRLGYLYYQMKNNLQLFYKYALQYIAYTPEQDMKDNEK